LRTDLSGMSALRSTLERDKLVVAESGISTAGDAETISGFDAALIGSAFMHAEDLESKVRELVSACRSVPR